MLIDVTAVKKAEVMLQEQKVKNAHLAGMAEISASVLHNIGNVLNSVNISVAKLNQLANGPSAAGLEKSMQLINQNTSNLSEFFSPQAKGPKLIEYLNMVSSEIAKDRQELQNEAQDLTRMIKLIKDVVASQQQYANGSILQEEVVLENLVEEVLHMQSAKLEEDKITVTKNYQPVKPLLAQKTKLIHVLLNITKNALESINLQAPSQKNLSVDIYENEQQKTVFKVTDNGLGITAENIEKIFQHGFTTKKDGHGFGMHFCASTISDMGGRMSVQSAGLGQGASVIIEF